MKSFNKDEQNIINRLKDLPEIKPLSDKDALYRRISQNIKSSSRPRKKKLNAIPLLSTSVVFIIIIIALPFLINFGENESTENLSTANYEINEKSSQSQTLMDKDNKSESNLVESENDADASEEAEMQNDDKMEDKQHGKIMQQDEGKISPDGEGKSLTVNELPNEEKLIYLALPDQQAQYVVPLTIKVDQEEDVNVIYNHLNDYLPLSELGLNESPLGDAEFDVDLDAKKVNLKIPDNFTLPGGSAMENMFEEVLTSMFAPYGIEEILINDGAGAELGQFGFIRQIPVFNAQRKNYKIYQTASNKVPFIIPIPTENLTLEEAFEDLKNPATEFDIYATIPDGVNFKLINDGQNLKIEFLNDMSNFEDNTMLLMIDSMLMTAKAYQFSTVEFIHFGVDSLHPYDLTNPVQVPKAINLINEH